MALWASPALALFNLQPACQGGGGGGAFCLPSGLPCRRVYFSMLWRESLVSGWVAGARRQRIWGRDLPWGGGQLPFGRDQLGRQLLGASRAVGWPAWLGWQSRRRVCQRRPRARFDLQPHDETTCWIGTGETDRRANGDASKEKPHLLNPRLSSLLAAAPKLCETPRSGIPRINTLAHNGLCNIKTIFQTPGI